MKSIVEETVRHYVECYPDYRPILAGYEKNLEVYGRFIQNNPIQDRTVVLPILPDALTSIAASDELRGLIRDLSSSVPENAVLSSLLDWLVSMDNPVDTLKQFMSDPFNFARSLSVERKAEAEDIALFFFNDPQADFYQGQEQDLPGHRKIFPLRGMSFSSPYGSN